MMKCIKKAGKENMEQRKTLIAIDGNSLMYRAYFALPDMTSRAGAHTGALHGFLGMLLKLAARKPDYMLIAFDKGKTTFRHAIYGQYKSGRKPMPDELREQMPVLKAVLGKMGIAVCECADYEADDILGTVARRAGKCGVSTLIVTGDRDALQLIDENTHVLMTKKGISETVEFDEGELMAQYFVTPSQIIDLKGLMGDASDAIPGIAGIGEKTAVKLLQKYGTLEEALTRGAVEEKGALQKKLEGGGESARLSYRLATIDTDAPIDIELENCLFTERKMGGARELLTELELRSIVSRLPVFEERPEPVKTESLTPVNTERIGTEEALKKLVLRLKGVKRMAIYIDDGLYVAVDGEGKTEQFEIVAGGNLLEPGLSDEEIFYALKAALEDEKIHKLTFDAKRLMHRLDRCGTVLNGLEFDAMIVDYLLHATRPANSLKELCELRQGLAPDAAALLSLYEPMMFELKATGMESLYRDMELPLIGVLFDMERTGFMIDTKMLRSIGDEMGERIKELAAAIYECAGGEFSILSTKQLGAVLYDKLGLPAMKKTKTGYSTDAETLEALREKHEIVPLVIEYRFLTKLKSTFIDGLIALVDKKTGRVHTSFNQNITATGRISSTEPNLQNIPVRTEMGREIRKAFIASPGSLLVGADYSQIELRLLAHIADDKKMQEAFLKKQDIHTRTASEVFGVPADEVTREQRSAAKAVNFGIVYGISDFGLAKNIGTTRSEAARYIQTYKHRYEGIRTYMTESIETAKKVGYAVTLSGRRRELPELKNSNYNTRSFGERVAMNMPIQGSAADIIKLAMVKVSSLLKRECPNARLILQVHDELIIDCPEGEAEKVSELLRECMENVAALRVPLEAEVKTGKSWYDTK